MDKPELTLIVGPSGCGKTYTLLREVLELELNKFDFVVIVCPTLSINTTYREWKYISSEQVYEIEVPSVRLELVLVYLIQVCEGCKPIRMAIVVDDMSSGTEQHKSSGPLSTIAFSGRHYGISLFLVSQKLNSISTSIRQNTTRVIFFPTPNKLSLRVLRDEFFGFLVDSDEKETLRKLKNSAGYLDISVPDKTYRVQNGRLLKKSK